MREWGRAFESWGKAHRRVSTVLSAPISLLALLLLSLIGLAIAGVETWLLVGVFALASATVAYVLVAFALFARVDPELLRTESYLIRKRAIDRSSFGDSLAGNAPASLPSDTRPVAHMVEVRDSLSLTHETDARG
jgi:hypothetical protein